MNVEGKLLRHFVLAELQLRGHAPDSAARYARQVTPGHFVGWEVADAVDQAANWCEEQMRREGVPSALRSV